MFRSLRYKNFRLYFLGQFVSLCGSWVQNTAQAWLMYRLTHDPLLLGLLAFVGQFPVFLFGFYAGLLVDRLNHFRLMRWTQTLAMFQAAVLAALVLTGKVQVWHLFALSFMVGLINSFDVPARQVMVGELVEPADRHNAIALNSGVVNGARIIGPGLAGLLIGWLDEGWCFALNAASYLFILGAMALMRDVRQPPTPPHGSVWEEIGRGLAYAMGREPIRLLLFLLAVFSLAGLPVYVLLPVFADDVLRSGARGLGLLSSSAGLGATMGALMLAWRENAAGYGGVIAGSLVLFGLSLSGLAFSARLWLSCLFLWVIGFSAIRILASANTLLQELADDRYRGRVMSFYSMLFIGISPIGSFLVGGLASRGGVTSTVLAQAAICVLVGSRFYRSLDRIK